MLFSRYFWVGAIVAIFSFIVTGCSDERRTLEMVNEELMRQCESLKKEVSRLENIINRNISYNRYYIIGSEASLMSDGIIQRVSGLSQEMKVNPENRYSLTKRMRRCDTDSIRVIGRRVRVLGDFPPSSYYITGKDHETLHYLIILDRRRFWNNNGLLIITYR